MVASAYQTRDVLRSNNGQLQRGPFCYILYAINSIEFDGSEAESDEQKQAEPWIK